MCRSFINKCLANIDVFKKNLKKKKIFNNNNIIITGKEQKYHSHDDDSEPEGKSRDKVQEMRQSSCTSMQTGRKCLRIYTRTSIGKAEQ